MLFAALLVNEFLARVHNFRLDGNNEFASHGVSLTHNLRYSDPDGEPCASLSRHVGRGDMDPLLEMPALSREPEVVEDE